MSMPLCISLNHSLIEVKGTKGQELFLKILVLEMSVTVFKDLQGEKLVTLRWC